MKSGTTTRRRARREPEEPGSVYLLVLTKKETIWGLRVIVVKVVEGRIKPAIKALKNKIEENGGWCCVIHPKAGQILLRELEGAKYVEKSGVDGPIAAANFITGLGDNHGGAEPNQ